MHKNFHTKKYKSRRKLDVINYHKSGKVLESKINDNSVVRKEKD